MTKLRTLVLGLLIGSTFGAGVALTGAAHATDRPNVIPAKVMCDHPAEDSLGHLRLEVFDHNPDGSYTLIYQCMRHGY